MAAALSSRPSMLHPAAPAEDDDACPICLAAITVAHQTRCGHLFCEPCWAAHLAASGEAATCPVCRQAVSQPCGEEMGWPLTAAVVNAAAREQGQYRTPHLNSSLSLEGLGLASIGRSATGTPLDSFHALLSLSLAQNNLSSLGSLSLPNLRRLSLATNFFATLSFLSGFPSLRWLDVSCNHLHDLAGVDAAPLLSHLVARRNLFSDATALQPLAELPTLSTLEIEGNRLSLSDLSPLERLPQLRVLGVADNPLGIEPTTGVHDAVLRRLPQVRILDGVINRRAENEEHKAAMEERRRRMKASSQAMIERKRRAELRRAAEECGTAWDLRVPQSEEKGGALAWDRGVSQARSPEMAEALSARPSSAPASFAASPPSAAACIGAAHDPLETKPAPPQAASTPAPGGAAQATYLEDRPASPQACGDISFIQSLFSTKVEYDQWRRNRLQLELNSRSHAEAARNHQEQDDVIGSV